ncbi:hypothetical protein H0H92_008383 [Tricholoma furcatifolium]|nr:hypothetical protein H0H92_008383 [Tricholoma furcatifolium]
MSIHWKVSSSFSEPVTPTPEPEYRLFSTLADDTGAHSKGHEDMLYDDRNLKESREVLERILKALTVFQDDVEDEDIQPFWEGINCGEDIDITRPLASGWQDIWSASTSFETTKAFAANGDDPVIHEMQTFRSRSSLKAEVEHWRVEQCLEATA